MFHILSLLLPSVNIYTDCNNNAYILVSTVCGVSAHLRSMLIVKYTTDHVAVVSAHRGYVLNDLVFTTCVLSTSFSSPDTPSLLARCFLQCPAGSRSLFTLPVIRLSLTRVTKNRLGFPGRLPFINFLDTF